MLETFKDAGPPSAAVRSAASQVMLKPVGIRMRMSPAAVMVGVAASSVIVSWLVPVGGSPTSKL